MDIKRTDRTREVGLAKGAPRQAAAVVARRSISGRGRRRCSDGRKLELGGEKLAAALLGSFANSYFALSARYFSLERQWHTDGTRMPAWPATPGGFIVAERWFRASITPKQPKQGAAGEATAETFMK